MSILQISFSKNLFWFPIFLFHAWVFCLHVCEVRRGHPFPGMEFGLSPNSNHLCGCWEANLAPLQEQHVLHVLLITEPALASLDLFFYCKVCERRNKCTSHGTRLSLLKRKSKSKFEMFWRSDFLLSKPLKWPRSEKWLLHDHFVAPLNLHKGQDQGLDHEILFFLTARLPEPSSDVWELASSSEVSYKRQARLRSLGRPL